MNVRFLRSFVTLGFVAATAACAALQTAGPGTRSGDVPAARPAAAATPLGFLYVVNYNDNDVSQLAVVPGSTQPIVPLAPNFGLPSGCTGPDAIDVIPAQNIAFVSCFSGEVLPLTLGKNHELEASSAAPVPVPSPVTMIAPSTGAKSVLYVSEYPGSVGVLSYGAKGLKLLQTQPTGSIYPDAMSLYTPAKGASTLFLAAPYAQLACGSSTGGAIERWTQKENGELVPQSAIPACAMAYDLIAIGGDVFWANVSGFGGYDIVHNKTLTLKMPFASGTGPGAYPNAMQPIGTLQNGKTAIAPADAPPQSDFTLDGTAGVVFVMRNGAAIASVDLATGVAPLTDCKVVSPNVTLNGVTYSEICYSLVGDALVVQGLRRDYKHAGIVMKYPLGSLPIAEVFAGVADFR